MKAGHSDKLPAHICQLESKVYLFTLPTIEKGDEEEVNLSLQATVLSRGKGLGCSKFQKQITNYSSLVRIKTLFPSTSISVYFRNKTGG